MQLRKAAIIGGVRIPFAKSFTSYSGVTNQDMLTFVFQQLVKKYSLQGKRIDDVAAGALIKHTGDWNLTRECVQSSGLSAETPGYDLQRACGTSLEAVINIANKIRTGQIEVGIAGGTDTNSDAPISYARSFAHRMIELNQSKSLGGKIKAITQFRPQDFKPVFPAVMEPRTGLSMGQHCEKMAQQWKVSREEQDQIAFASHQNGIKAYEEGFFNDLVVPYQGLKRDPTLRADTSLEKLAKLKPAFERSEKGTLTAGNSSPLSDGSAAVLIASEEYAKRNKLPILAYVVDAQVAAVDYVKQEGLLMAPAYAVPVLLARNGLKLQDFDFYEIHEAFAAQVLCTLKAWESKTFCETRLGLKEPLGSIDRAKLNVKGSSIAIGHPFAATGARITATLAKTLDQAGKGRGLISICTAGGMGVTAILEK